MTNQFGELVKELRIGIKKTLRSFCSELSFDPSNWSKIERGINPAPKPKSLENIALYFDLKGQSKIEFMDAAALSKGQLPNDIVSNDILMKKMPVFFRNIRNEQVIPNDQIDNLMDDIRKLNTADEA